VTTAKKILATKSGIYYTSVWSVLSAACLRLRGGHRQGEKLGSGTLATLERCISIDSEL